MKKTPQNNYTTINILLGCMMIIMAGALIYCGANIKSTSDKEFLNLRGHLFSRFIKLNYEKDNQLCEVEKYGVSSNNEVYVRFWCQKYDSNTHKPASEKEFNTLYFQHPKTIEGGTTGYAEALGE